MFTGVTKNYLAIPLDAITVGEAPARDLAAVSLSIPETVTTGQYFDIEVDVENAGTQSVGGYVVELYRNGEKIQEAEGPELYSCTRTQVGFSDRLEVINNGDNEYYAKVVCEGMRIQPTTQPLWSKPWQKLRNILWQPTLKPHAAAMPSL